MIEGLLQGFGNLVDPMNIFALLVAIFIGFLGGAMPGISGTMLVIVLLPVTYGMAAEPAFLMLTGIYAAAVFSGLITAILFRTPGTPEAIVTVFDGYAMTKKGQAGQALGVGILCSAIGGIVGTIALIFLTPPLAKFALQFSSPEFFALAVLGLTVVASLSGGDLIRGIIGVLLGLFIATIGMDAISGTPRFDFGTSYLKSGIDLIPILTGLFAVSEVLKKAGEDHTIQQKFEKVKTKIFDSKIFKQIAGTMARSIGIGIFIGILPGVGATTASMISYSEAIRWSKRPEKFGTGIPEGVAAPESANNTAAMGSLIPLLALGIPGSATTAIILGAFILHGIQPGPMLMTTSSELVYTIFAGLLVVNASILVLAKPFINMFAHFMKVPYSILAPFILVFCIIGTFAVRNSLLDVWVMLLFGLIGFYLEKLKFPLATIILGIVLGPIAEAEFRRSLMMSGGDYSVFFTRPISLILLIAALFALFAPYLSKLTKKNVDRSKTTA